VPSVPIRRVPIDFAQLAAARLPRELPAEMTSTVASTAGSLAPRVLSAYTIAKFAIAALVSSVDARKRKDLSLTQNIQRNSQSHSNSNELCRCSFGVLHVLDLSQDTLFSLYYVDVFLNVHGLTNKWFYVSSSTLKEKADSTELKLNESLLV
jgi:hypothetical protein